MDYSDDDDVYMESEDENLYSDDEDRETDYEYAEADMKQSKSYVVLKEEDIRKSQKDDIERVSTVLSVTKVEAIVLLLHYHWNVIKVEDDWFADKKGIRKTVGLLKKPVFDLKGKKKKINCGICFESYKRKDMASVSCGHPYCKTCWSGYITTMINDGSVCLRVRCPEPSCSAIVGQDMIDKFTKGKDKKKYYNYFFRSYVEEGKKIKWCPSPGCEYAIEFKEIGHIGYDITCLCSYKFCWNCCEETHTPVDCETVSKWLLKNRDDSENMNWILSMTKSCPKCKRPIEKNHGCNHMTCRPPCKHQFCWVCIEPWSTHKACNAFKDDEYEKKRKRAKAAIDKYTHYYERWGFNQSSRKKAISDLEKWQSKHLKELSDRQCISEIMLQFTIDAWLQIIECRRVLKWTYAYGYYLPKRERAKRRFFEYLQGEAETGLERLHHCAEEELNKFISESEESQKDFNEFKIKLIELTEATKTYFKNLVKALENGLIDVTYTEARRLKSVNLKSHKKKSHKKISTRSR